MAGGGLSGDCDLRGGEIWPGLVAGDCRFLGDLDTGDTGDLAPVGDVGDLLKPEPVGDFSGDCTLPWGELRTMI